MKSTYHLWKDRIEQNNKLKKQEFLTEEKNIAGMTILIFLVLMTGVILGYAWCWYHLGG